jgi:hypothetical protein
MNRLFIFCALIILIVISGQIEGANSAAFILIGSNPINGETVRVPDLLDSGIYLKFNNPVDRAYEQYIGLLHRDEDGFRCQWNVCGWIEYSENDTKVIWHPNESFINATFKPGEHFEIDIGFADLGISYNLRDTQGNLLDVTRLEFSIDACQPSVNVQVSGNPRGICSLGPVPPFSYFIPGDTVNVTFDLTNPTCGHQITLEGKAWVILPDESVISFVTPDRKGVPLLSKFFKPLIFFRRTFQMAPGQTFSIKGAQYTFSGKEPPGVYIIGLRILDPITGSSYASATTGFDFDLCP